LDHSSPSYTPLAASSLGEVLQSLDNETEVHRQPNPSLPSGSSREDLWVNMPHVGDRREDVFR